MNLLDKLFLLLNNFKLSNLQFNNNFFLKKKSYNYNFLSFFFIIFKLPFSNTKITNFYININITLSSLITFIRWLKVRLSYLSNNWVYSTNHKRIAINYFNFVLIGATAGAGCATIIRMEFAYPGVGILAGDSLQYLSICTAHGVIMVFFMIMPAIFGGFGNFLLPTQLGVHDVAFPRLNSAAFWFLPGGLIMLFQLVCVDRRYSRLNCFNIRELESVLKRKFFTDLVNFSDHHSFLNNTILSLRFKNNTNNLGIAPDQSIFYNYGISSLIKNKSNDYILNNLIVSTLNLNNLNNLLINYFIKNINLSIKLKLYKDNILILFYELQNIFIKLNMSVIYLFDLSFLKLLLISNFNITFLFSNFITNTVINYNNWSVNNFFYKSENIINTENFFKNQNSSIEASKDFRFLRFFNPLISYDYKTGHYIGVWDQLYPALSLSYIEVARGIRKASWFYSEQYVNLLKQNFDLFLSKFSLKKNLKLSEVNNWKESSISPNDSYFSIFFFLQKNESFFNLRWLSLNSLDQKFYLMFHSTSTQQRLLSNWRSLKFSREAWRSKLLISRHQNTMYKRFVGEESLIWSVERNAKDLLPGWAMITPFSARLRFTAIGKVDVGLLGVLFALNASIVASANFLVTYRYLSTLNNRKMRDAKSFFVEGLIVASWMILAANPMLSIAILMLLSDRHWQTCFFDYSGGGDTVMFQHMFWFFGHPEVYIIMIPIFGFVNTVLSYYLRKRISARASLMYSMYTIAALGFFVWGHHMYMVGLSHTTRMLFSTLTVMISVPAATKLMHWAVTLINNTLIIEVPLLFAMSMIFFFVTGGISGMHVANTGMDILFHDTFYVVGHFHIMLSAAASTGVFAAFYFYFPALYGLKYSRVYAYIHYFYYFFGQFITMCPMLYLGYCGMPRRVLDYPTSLGGWHSIASSGHFITLAAVCSFFIMIYDSVRQAKPAVRTTFGIGRFNTRLNFYFFEINRLFYIQKKNFHNYRYNKNLFFKKNKLNKIELVNIESILFSYTFFKK